MNNIESSHTGTFISVLFNLSSILRGSFSMCRSYISFVKLIPKYFNFFFCLFSVNGIFKDFTFNRHMDTEGEEESEANWESSIGIYTLLCVKQTASGKLVYSTGSSARCSVMTHWGRMGWVGERFKREWKFKKIRKKRFHFPKKRFHCCRCRGI